jgi:hypothetical protein
VITFKVEPLASAHVQAISQAFAAVGWPGKEADLYRRYLGEQDHGTRTGLVAVDGTGFYGPGGRRPELDDDARTAGMMPR